LEDVVEKQLGTIFNSTLTVAVLAASLMASAVAQNNPVPQIVGPVHPSAVAPGSEAFTLHVYGANFVPGSVVNWNYQPRVTTYVSGHEIQAQILDTDVETNTAGYITVTNPAPGGGSSSASWAQVEVHDPISTITLRQQTYYPFGFWSLQAADFTHDGILDLVGESYGLSFEFGTPNGTFLPGPIISDNFNGITQFAYGDFNGDGNLDVAFDLGQTLQITQMAVMLGDGKGAFSDPTLLSEREGLGQPVAGDFNQDGKLDLITTGREFLLEFLGNGDGTFRKPVSYPYGYLGTAMQLGDFNGDGKLDLILVGAPTGNMNFWYMQGNGDGTFQRPKQILTRKDTNGCGATLQNDMQVSDFNGDGKLDFAFCDGNGIGIMLGNGDGTFQPPFFYTFDTKGFGEFTFAVGDINSDGIQDLTVSEYEQWPHTDVTFLLGNGDGTFQPPQSLADAEAELGITVGDFDSNGLLDFILQIEGGMFVALQ
jgi:hypothetical protein